MIYEQPPTLSSGFGVLTTEDQGKTPIEILDVHEKKVKAWVDSVDEAALKVAINTAVSNQHFPQFKRDLWEQVEDRKFGTAMAEDLLRFDMWLKKLEISNNRAMLKPPTPKTASPVPPPADEKAPVENPEAYKQYWQQFQRKRANSDLSVASTTPSRSPNPEENTSSTTPSTSPGSAVATPTPTGITPEVKKKLELSGLDINVLYMIQL